MEPFTVVKSCSKCRAEINWKKILIKTLLKIFISGLIKALITHIVLSHMKNGK